MSRFLLTASVLMLIGGVATAEVESGPKEGEKVTKLPVFGVSGKVEDKEADYAAERKGEPTIYLFVNADMFKDQDAKLTRPIHRFIRTLDEKVTDVSGGACVAVWVGGEMDKNKTFAGKVKQYYSNTSLAVFDGDSNGPNGWGLNSAAHLTVVVVYGDKVVKSFAYESVNETDVKAVEEAFKKAAEKK